MLRNRVRKSTTRAFESLESKRLLAASIDFLSGGLFDFVGDTSSVGPDGYLDPRINIISLPAKEVASVRVETIKFVNDVSTVNYTWAYGANSMLSRWRSSLGAMSAHLQTILLQSTGSPIRQHPYSLAQHQAVPTLTELGSRSLTRTARLTPPGRMSIRVAQIVISKQRLYSRYPVHYSLGNHLLG